MRECLRSRGANASEVCKIYPPFPREGRGECRVPTHPQPRMQNKKAYELVTTGRPDDPAFPHAMVLTVSFVISPVIGLVCHRRFACAKLDASVEASGPHDFAVRVQHRSSAVPNSVHRIPSRVRDDRERPSVGRDGAIRKVFCLVLEARYFCGQGWTGVLRNSPARVIASAAKQSSFERHGGLRQAGLLRRFAPSANASRLSQAMTDALTSERYLSLPLVGRVAGRRPVGWGSPSALRILSMAPARLSFTSEFQNRRTLKPCDTRKVSRMQSAFSPSGRP